MIDTATKWMGAPFFGREGACFIEGAVSAPANRFGLTSSVETNVAVQWRGVMAHEFLQVERLPAASLGGALPRHCRAVNPYSLLRAKGGRLFLGGNFESWPQPVLLEFLGPDANQKAIERRPG